MIRRLPLVLLFALVIGGSAAACESETGPGAPARTGNGCIGETCYDAADVAEHDAGDQ